MSGTVVSSQRSVVKELVDDWRDAQTAQILVDRATKDLDKGVQEAAVELLMSIRDPPRQEARYPNNFRHSSLKKLSKTGM